MGGRLIRIPKHEGVRPTTERVREAVFDVLGEVSGLRVVDLFAGSGALGLEALSRGAKWCSFVERDPSVAAVLRKNIDTLRYGDKSRVLVCDYLSAVTSLGMDDTRFDLLFVDPPYKMLAEVEEALSSGVHALLSPGGVMVIEGPSSHGNDFGLQPVFERKYGDTTVTMVRVGE